eukprot:4667374-Lingulodinium_polyedra.AAC.1
MDFGSHLPTFVALLPAARPCLSANRWLGCGSEHRDWQPAFVAVCLRLTFACAALVDDAGSSSGLLALHRS